MVLVRSRRIRDKRQPEQEIVASPIQPLFHTRSQAEYLRVLNCSGHSFEVREWRCPVVHTKWHYHSEYEITLLEGVGQGTRCVGNEVRPFVRSDLVMIGPFLPHCWRTSARRPDVDAHSVVILFSPDCLGRDFFFRPEMKGVTRLLTDSLRGVRFFGRARQEAALLMRKLPSLEGPERILRFLEVLMLLSKSAQRDFLSEKGYACDKSKEATRRIDRVCRYIEENLRQPLSLSVIARLANMGPAPFCRFFKKVTALTPFAFINRTRIEYASRLLVDTDLSISEICYSSGYASLSNFNRCFREQKGLSPSEFRRRFQDVLLRPTGRAALSRHSA